MSNKQPSVEELSGKVMDYLDKAMAMNLDMAKDDSAYDLNYISKKLAECSSYIEKLSDYSMDLTKLSIKIRERCHAEDGLLALETRDAKASEEYKTMEHSAKTSWLVNHLLERQHKVDSWNALRQMVLDVRQAITDRATTLKRLDSDIRLHSKLYESKVAAGAVPSAKFLGNKDLDLDL